MPAWCELVMTGRGKQEHTELIQASSLYDAAARGRRYVEPVVVRLGGADRSAAVKTSRRIPRYIRAGEPMVEEAAQKCLTWSSHLSFR
jgi:hypothetical protein